MTVQMTGKMSNWLLPILGLVAGLYSHSVTAATPVIEIEIKDH
jgi:hypothetical protein